MVESNRKNERQECNSVVTPLSIHFLSENVIWRGWEVQLDISVVLSVRGNFNIHGDFSFRFKLHVGKRNTSLFY